MFPHESGYDVFRTGSHLTTECVTVSRASCELADTSPVWNTADTTTN